MNAPIRIFFKKQFYSLWCPSCSNKTIRKIKIAKKTFFHAVSKGDPKITKSHFLLLGDITWIIANTRDRVKEVS